MSATANELIIERNREAAEQESPEDRQTAREGDTCSALRAPRSALERRVWEVLREVYDPEIPTISVVDLGIVHRVEATPERVRVEILPTFIGCPAIEVMREAIRERLVAEAVAPEVSVGVTFAAQWSSDRITPAGHERLREAGFAPPADAPAFVADVAGKVLNLNPLGAVRPALVACPYCGSKSTTLENRFGPTLCRSIYHCNNCRQPFEAFKAV